MPSLICFAFLLSAQVPADEKDSESKQHYDRKNVVVPAGEVIDYDYFAIGDSIEISGIVSGDMYSAGGLVLLDGQIHGELPAARGKLPSQEQFLGMLAFITLLPFLGAVVTFLALLFVLEHCY